MLQRSINSLFAKIIFTHWVWVCLLVWFGTEHASPRIFEIVSRNNGIPVAIIGAIYLVLSTAYCIYVLSKRNLNASAALLWTVGFFVFPYAAGPFLYWLYLHRQDASVASA